MTRLKQIAYESRLLAVLFLAFGFVFFDRLALSYLFPFVSAEIGLSHTEFGMLSSVLALAWALSGLVTGFVSLLVFRACMGLAEGLVLPLAQTMMVQASSPHRRGLNMGLLQGSSAGLMGAVSAPPIMVALAEHLGWHTAFYLGVVFTGSGLLRAGVPVCAERLVVGGVAIAD